MKNNLKISVVLCAKNEEKRIENSLVGILRNNVDEIIVVDGNSSDKTAEIAKQYTNNVIVSNAKSLTIDRQIGVNKCKNSYIAMIDADHVLKENDIHSLYLDLKSFNFDIVQSQLKSFKNISFLNFAEEDSWNLTHNIPGIKNMIGTAPAIYRKEIFDFIKFDGNITKKIDDTDFIYRLSKLKKYRYGIGYTKISQLHDSNFLDYLKKFLWYGHGDAEFIHKHPHKIISIIYHLLFRYLFIYSFKSLMRGKFKAIPFYMMQGIFRFVGLIRYSFIKK